MLKRFNKRRLKYVFRHIRTSGHTQGMSVQGVAVTGYEYPERILVTCQDPGDYLLIRINYRHPIYGCRALRTRYLGTLILQRRGCHLHLPSVIRLPAGV
jgi:hypothetical protein